MATTYHEGLLPEDAAPQPKRWTVDEFVRLSAEGSLGEGRYELIEGQIVSKMGQNGPHIFSMIRCTEALRMIFGRDFTFVQQSTLRLSDADAPEPDIAVFRGNPAALTDAPNASDAVLLVEVADTRLDTAQGPKVALYARHGIPEYWVVDLRSRTLTTRTGPRPDGTWTVTRVYEEGESARPQGQTEEIPVADLLPRM